MAILLRGLLHNDPGCESQFDVLADQSELAAAQDQLQRASVVRANVCAQLPTLLRELLLQIEPGFTLDQPSRTREPELFDKQPIKLIRHFDPPSNAAFNFELVNCLQSSFDPEELFVVICFSVFIRIFF